MKLNAREIAENARDWLAASDPPFRAGEMVDREQLGEQLEYTNADAEDVEAIASTIEHLATQEGAGAKEERMRRSDKPRRILELADSGCYRTLQAIGSEVGLTKERVRQVLRAAGRVKRCGGRWFQPRLTYHAACGHQVGAPGRRRCGACRHADAWVTLTCEACGRGFLRKAAQYRYKQRHGYRHVVCSRRCWARIAFRYPWPQKKKEA